MHSCVLQQAKMFLLLQFPLHYDKDRAKPPLGLAFNLSLQIDNEPHSTMLLLLLLLPTWSTFYNVLLAIISLHPMLKIEHWVALGRLCYGTTLFLYVADVTILQLVANFHCFTLDRYTEVAKSFTGR